MHILGLLDPPLSALTRPKTMDCHREEVDRSNFSDNTTSLDLTKRFQPHAHSLLTPRPQVMLASERTGRLLHSAQAPPTHNVLRLRVGIGQPREWGEKVREGGRWGGRFW